MTSEPIGLLRAWIGQGAAWPDETAITNAFNKSDWWSFQPASRPALPKVKHQKWVHNPIDHFVLATLAGKKMSPSPETNRRMLIRRLTVDLTNLPPVPEEAGDFLRDQDQLG